MAEAVERIEADVDLPAFVSGAWERFFSGEADSSSLDGFDSMEGMELAAPVVLDFDSGESEVESEDEVSEEEGPDLKSDGVDGATRVELESSWR